MKSRSAGILLHITSLPSPYGVGDFGPDAFQFVDFLQRSGQSVWQILPLCPTTFGDSPYSSYSAFAGNVRLISPDQLVSDGWIDQAVIDEAISEIGDRLISQPERANFAAAEELKLRLLESAFNRLILERHQLDAFQEYCHQESSWLDALAQFEALREYLQENDWTEWPAHLRGGSIPEPLQIALGTAITYARFKQFVFDQQWQHLKAYANQKGIQICGDMPIFVAHDSADVWANQSQFLLDATGRPTVVAGVPPDYFSKTGQLWGNPLYNWDAMSENGFAWWVNRFRRALNQYDLLRVDHFRGFAAYWEIPAGASTAVDGVWKKGPREMPFLAAQQALGPLPIWAEDLGEIDQPVHDIRDRLGFPSMRVMQFGFDKLADDMHRHTTYTAGCIGYTGTHDNDTLMGWVQSRRQSIAPDQPDLLAEYLNGDEAIHLQIVKLLYESQAQVAVVPLQDAMGLGGEARMNVPGNASGNWQWRLKNGDLTDDLAEKIQALVLSTGRIQSPMPSLT